MNERHDSVILLDVDNTLLDNDAVERDLRQHLRDAFGAECQERYWEIFERLRAELGYADYLGALQRYRVEHPRDPRLLETSLFLIDYPFASRLYPLAREAIGRLREWGLPVILSDGDVVFQPRKIARSGLWEAVDGHVLIYIHKERMLDDVERRYPARQYVMVDDKLRILSAMKEAWGATAGRRHTRADRRPRRSRPRLPVRIHVKSVTKSAWRPHLHAPHRMGATVL